MLSTRLIQRLLKRLCQVLAALTTSSAQRLRILVSCFRHFVINLIPRHNTDSTSSSPPDCCTVFTGAGSNARCPQTTLPLHNRHITSARAASGTGTQDVVLSSTLPLAMPQVPSILQQPVPLQMSPPTNAGNTISSNTPVITPHFVPFAANDVSRYENRPLVDESRQSDRIPALMRRFDNESCPWLNGSDWQSYVHPEGVLYLYNDHRRTFTEANMNKSMFSLIDGCVNALYDLPQAKSVNLEADDIELVVQVAQVEARDGVQLSCHYYFVDHTARTLFWLHDYHQENLLSGLQGVTKTRNLFSGLQGVADPSHIRYVLESEYWCVTCIV
ncbi:uncharacterized protein EDB91DRAFT_1185136 [Suillus paluster]|uniref:uncharacterized protein n=1 Tax=Suillus paluster TaxID=48578 RepID=UPI001B862E22|nr:uncharacterized protein EDB91DRAFT_1185136 [Suillus paluster]KAG1718506.1 hypothetical protein EDB91DRAFT_1185136 [Suillus paluster]